MLLLLLLVVLLPTTITTTPLSKLHSLDAPAPFPLSGGNGVKDAEVQSEQQILIVNRCYYCQPELTIFRVSHGRALTLDCTVRLRGPTSKLA